MPAHKIGRLWKFKKDEVDIWVRDGKEHFKALGKEVEFAATNAFEEFSGKYV